MKRTTIACPTCGQEISRSNYQRHLDRHKNHPETFKPSKWAINHEGLSCQFCGKECKNKNSLCNHERMCKQNPNHDVCYIDQYNKDGHPAWNKGLTKETNQSVLSYALKNTKEKPDWQKKVDDDNKLYKKYLNKIINAKKGGLVCELTFFEYCSLVDKAGLKSSDLGFSGKKYVLARYNDEGNYTYNNCRFITQSENMAEQKLSQKNIEQRSSRIKIINEQRKFWTEEQKAEFGKRISEGIKNSPKLKEKFAESEKKKIEKV